MRVGYFACLAALFFTLIARAENPFNFSTDEAGGRALVQQILTRQPAENATNTGTLAVNAGEPATNQVTFETRVTDTNWLTRYQARRPDGTETVLLVTHTGTNASHYFLTENGIQRELAADQTMIPFAGSDFWVADLGLEFFHWPRQKILKKETHRSRGCARLESVNPHPATNGYARVVCWIDEESFGIVEAYAYDANGRELKNFYPKDFEKIAGQYQLKSMVMKNRRTKSESVMEFNLEK